MARDRPSLFGNLLGDNKTATSDGLELLLHSHLTSHSLKTFQHDSRYTQYTYTTSTVFQGPRRSSTQSGPAYTYVKTTKTQNKNQRGCVVAGPHVVCCQGPLRSSLSVLQSYVLSHARKRNFARATDPVRPSVRPSPLPSTSSSSPPPGRSVSTFTTRRRRKSAALRPDTATSASPPPRSAARSTPR